MSRGEVLNADTQTCEPSKQKEENKTTTCPEGEVLNPDTQA